MVTGRYLNGGELPMEAVEQRKIIKAVRNEPALAEVFKVPILSLPTSLLFWCSM